MSTDVEKNTIGKTGQIVKIYIVLIFTVASLYYENYYSDMIEAKARITEVILAFLAFFGLIFIFKDKAQWRKQEFSSVDAAVLAFMTSSIVSSLFSQFRLYSFSGSCGWMVGTLQIVLLGLAYFVVSRNFVPKRSVFYISCAGVFVVLAIAFLNGFGLDPFEMHLGLSDSVAANYISTIGNVNTFSGYICLILFFLVGTYVDSKEKKIKIVCAGLIFISSCCALMCNSDSFWLGSLFAGAAAGLYIRRFPKKILEFSEMGIIFSVASGVVSFLLLTGVSKTVFNGFTRVYLKHSIWIFAFLVFVAIRIAYVKLENLIVNRAKLLSNIYFILLVTIFSAVVIYTVCHFDDTWGTYRGFIWKNAVNMFGHFSLKNKLFGIGTDCFGIVFNDCFGKQINDIYNMPVLNAHNEFLQYLISNGIFGVLSYSALYFTVIYDEITNPKKHVSDINVFMPVCAYLGQALINNPHMMNYIVLFLFISIIQKNRQQL